MAQKIVGITCSTLAATEKDGSKHALNRAYADSVERAGGIPVILPPTLDPRAPERYLSIVDGLLFSGGVDVDPAEYGENGIPQLGPVDLARDALEIQLARIAVVAGKPIFGICRGIQLLNVALGGDLYQDLPVQNPSEIVHQQSAAGKPRDVATHSIVIDEESRLRTIAAESEMMTNSFHHQAVRRLGRGLRVTARTEDGIIEALELPASRYFLAVQFHPEETAASDEKSQRLFDAFVQAL